MQRMQAFGMCIVWVWGDHHCSGQHYAEDDATQLAIIKRMLGIGQDEDLPADEMFLEAMEHLDEDNKKCFEDYTKAFRVDRVGRTATILPSYPTPPLPPLNPTQGPNWEVFRFDLLYYCQGVRDAVEKKQRNARAAASTPAKCPAEGDGRAGRQCGEAKHRTPQHVRARAPGGGLIPGVYVVESLDRCCYFAFYRGGLPFATCLHNLTELPNPIRVGPLGSQGASSLNHCGTGR
jgi:hypothetical protein